MSIEVKENSIIIKPVKNKLREGWEEQFKAADSLDNKENLMGDFDNKFDVDEWTW